MKMAAKGTLTDCLSYYTLISCYYATLILLYYDTLLLYYYTTML